MSDGRVCNYCGRINYGCPCDCPKAQEKRDAERAHGAKQLRYQQRVAMEREQAARDKAKRRP